MIPGPYQYLGAFAIAFAAGAVAAIVAGAAVLHGRGSRL